MIRDTVIKVLGGVAVALGTAVFVLWKLFTHERNRRDAEIFVHNTPRAERDKVVEDLGAKRAGHDETVEALRDEVESETKREVIDGFKKAFGVKPAVGADDDDSGGTGE